MYIQIEKWSILYMQRSLEAPHIHKDTHTFTLEYQTTIHVNRPTQIPAS